MTSLNYLSFHLHSLELGLNLIHMNSVCAADTLHKFTISSKSRIQIIFKRGDGCFLFPAINQSEETSIGEEEEMIEFNVVGILVDSFLKDKAKSHTITFELARAKIEEIKALLNFNANRYRWPFFRWNTRFTSKDSRGDVYREV